jgi:hypothetical protein
MGGRVYFMKINTVDLVCSADQGDVDIMDMSAIALHIREAFVGIMKHDIRQGQPDNNQYAHKDNDQA